MNITKEQLRQIVKEETENQSLLQKALDLVTGKRWRNLGTKHPLYTLFNKAIETDSNALSRVISLYGHTGGAIQEHINKKKGKKMNITKEQLRQIVKEEVTAVLSEGSTADRKWRDNQANPDHGKKGAPDAAAIDALEPHDITSDLDDFIRFNTTPGYEDERVPGKTAHQRKRADLPPEEPKYDDSHLRALGYLEEGEDSYPAPSKMKKLVKQATLNGRYKPTSEEQLKKDYDKHVRSTLRDPKHSEAHKKE